MFSEYWPDGGNREVHGKGCLCQDDTEYMEDEGDWVDIVGKYELKGRKELLNIDGKDTDLTSINLSPDKIANSLTEFLVKQKVIRSRRNARVELWGEDGNGKYMCVLIASPWEKGWGINVYSRERMNKYELEMRILCQV